MEEQKTQKIIKQDLKNCCEENVNGIIYYLGLFYVIQMVKIKLISKHHKDPVAKYFGIKKT